MKLIQTTDEYLFEFIGVGVPSNKPSERLLPIFRIEEYQIINGIRLTIKAGIGLVFDSEVHEYYEDLTKFIPLSKMKIEPADMFPNIDCYVEDAGFMDDYGYVYQYEIPQEGEELGDFILFYENELPELANFYIPNNLMIDDVHEKSYGHESAELYNGYILRFSEIEFLKFCKL